MLEIAVTKPRTLSVTFSAAIVSTGGDPYTGPYTVTPKVNTETILQTNEKRMTDNVTVLVVPQYETDNLSGGKTLTIGTD